MTQTSRWISVADTAKLVRTDLKASFPEVKFSVKSKSYSMGASINVTWTDGPTTDQVDRVVKKYAGASFDGMEDLKNYHDSTLNGEAVHYGADYIFTNRTHSLNLVTKVAQAYCAWSHAEMPAINVYDTDACVECRHWDSNDAGAAIMKLVRDCAENELEGLTICISRGRISIKRADTEDDQEVYAAAVAAREESTPTATVEPVQEVTAPTTPVQSIHEIITGMQTQFEGKPSQDLLHLILQEEQEEGPHNDGLLSAYITEAHDTLSYLVQAINEERLYKRVLAGETVHVQVASTGKAFTIRTTPENATGLPAYDIVLPSGKVEKRGLILDKTALRNWIYGLVEVD